MKSNEFVPELHDIGKLADKALIKSQHNLSWNNHVFIDFDFTLLNIQKPDSTPSWWGQYHQQEELTSKDINSWNNNIRLNCRPDLFLLILSDHLASSISRAFPRIRGISRNSTEDGILKLWNIQYYQKKKSKGNHWAAFTDLNSFKSIFNEFYDCHSGDDFLNKYKKHLLLCPEDKKIPRNITSLFTHLSLVGKIWRVLNKNIKITQDSKGQYSLEFCNLENKRAKIIESVEGSDRTDDPKINEKGLWQARIIKGEIKFPHSFVRLHDLNLLKKREEIVSSIINKYNNEVLLSTSNFFIIFLPLNQDINEIFLPLLEWGFFIEIEEVIADLGILSSTLHNKFFNARKNNNKIRISNLNQRDTKIYKKYLFSQDLKDEIKPPICDICQRKQGKERIKGTIREFICKKCQEIRDMGEPFTEYSSEWEDENAKVCWLMFSLNQDKLENWLKNAISNYLNSIFNNITFNIEEEFRFLAPQVDFNNDYKKMLGKFWKKYKNLEDLKMPIENFNEIGVFQYSSEKIIQIIKDYIGFMHQYFPDCSKNEDSPINLSLSISNIKYPIREHWKYFEESKKNFLNIKHHHIFEEIFSEDEVKNILHYIIEVESSSAFIQKLVQLNEKLDSTIYISLELFNNREKHPEIYKMVRQGIDPKKILNLYKLLKKIENE